MKFLLLFSFLAYVTAQRPDVNQLLSGSLIQLGSYDAVVKIGNLSKLYKNLNSQDLVASRSAKQLVEEIRRMFKVGIYTLPPLDPYVREHLPPLVIDNDLYISSGTIQLKNLCVTGAQRFNLDFLEVRVETERVDLGVTVPNINIDVDVTVDVMIASLLPVHLTGHLSLLLNNVSVREAVQAKQVLRIGRYYYQLVGQHSHLHADNVAFKLTNIKVDDVLKHNALGSSPLSVPEILTNLKKHIDKYTASLLLRQINNVLLGPTAEQVLAYLLPETVSK